MSGRTKVDAAGITAFLDSLEKERWLGEQRRSWPRFVWHYSHIENIAAILKAGRLFSRDQLIRRGIISREIAQREIIEQTPWAHAYVRLYFRPLTPTQYSIEGIRRDDEVTRGVQCPVPVFLLFDARDLLTREECEFTDSNFARNAHRKGNTARFLKSLNFKDIYHNSSTWGCEDRRKREIIGARCAEVLFRDELDLEALKEIVCRSPAERATLLALLEKDADRWRKLIRVTQPSERLFFGDHAYVSEVRLLEDCVLIEWQPRPGRPYDYEATVRGDVMGLRRYKGTAVKGRLKLLLPAPEQRVSVEFRLAGCLAYKGYPSKRSIFS